MSHPLVRAASRTPDPLDLEPSFVGYLTTDAGTPMVGLVGPLALASIEGEALARAGRRRRLLGWLGLGRRVA